ncbi:YihY/virulence factor BrkB family protein [Edaphobacillus lindanitolerans]|uniref:Membrane protein n=1 Tax=Edaphobacillus lindanitolerans TaxID=550447 RepID=A0A1U7PNR3_9BACI|nr:YihY/virulence factor BrkB family protein [Edaphobacillus lindanitolerans]SIT93143.1 membrane protein [Edaphobacillus lindanitolerans]
MATDRKKREHGRRAVNGEEGLKDKVKTFVEDVNDGDLVRFDVTTGQGFFKELLTRIKMVDVTGLGSQLAYFFLLSMFPLLIFLLTLLPYLNIDQSAIFSFLKEYAPANVYSIIDSTVGEILDTRRGGLLSFGIIGTIWSASSGMNRLSKALNQSYFAKEKRSYFVTRGLSVVFTLALVAVVAVALALPVFGQQIGQTLFSYFGLEQGFLTLWNSIRWVIPPVLIFTVFTLIYWLVPDAKVRFKDAVPGGIFSTVGWILTSLGFSFYVGNFGNYSNTYGSIGGIIVLMIWMYLSAMILIVGGQINAVMQERREVKRAKEKSGVIGA